MAFVGMNVDREGTITPDWLVKSGCTWLRIVATPEVDLTTYLENCRKAGLRTLLVLARESGDDYQGIATRYGHLVNAVQIGNEPDLESASSWTMTPRELASRGRAVKRAFPHIPVVAGGLASGQPGWIEGADLSWADAIAVHPYLKDAPSSSDIEDLEDVTTLLDAYRHVGKPILITEWGWWGNEESRAAEEVLEFVAWAASTHLIEGFFYFCATDAMVPPFGLLKADGKPKARYSSFTTAAKGQSSTGWPRVVSPPPTPEPPAIPDGPNPWEFFTAQQIAGVTQCPLDEVTNNWPKLVEQLHHCRLNTRPSQIAMIATVAIETARTFRPVREAFWTSEAWRRANLRYYPYYGRGYIQLTWGENYRKYGPLIAALWNTSPDQPDFDLVNFPDRALDPDISAAVSALYFRDHGGSPLIPEAAARQDWREVRRLVQGGDAGLAEFTQMADTLWNLPIPTPEPKPPLRTKDDILREIHHLLHELEQLP